MDPSNFDSSQFKLNLPTFAIKIRHGDKPGALQVYDSLRAKYVALTPEEYVRQHFTHFLVNYLHYPASHLSNEVALTLNGTPRRCDTLVYDKTGMPLMVVEYKAPYVNIDQEVFDQIVQYNMVVKARYLAVSNGMRHYCCIIDIAKGTYNFLPSVPDYDVMDHTPLN